MTAHDEFQATIEQLAAWHGWAAWHDYDPRKNKAGWPDLFLCRPPRIMVVECKVGRDVTSAEQREWLQRFADCGIEAVVFRPDRAPKAERWPVVSTMDPVERDGRRYEAGLIECRLFRRADPPAPARDAGLAARVIAAASRQE